MPIPAGSTAVDDAVSGESTITDLLEADLAETTEQTAEDTSLGGSDIVVEGEPASTQDEGATDEPTEGADDAPAEGTEGEGEGSGDDDFEAETLETDFAESAYQRAAAHWEKRGVKLDPSDPGQRALLKELMDRGQKIRELSTREDTPKEEPAPAAEPAAVTKTPAEQLTDTITESRNYAKASFNPVAAKEVTMPVVKALAKVIWGKDAEKFVAGMDARSGEELRELSEALHTAMAVAIIDAIPSIRGAVPQVVAQAYPFLNDMHTEAEKQSAAKELVTAVDTAGQPQYPGIDRLIENGTIKRLMNGPELKDAVFSPDRQKNFVAKAKAAYKMARGGAVDPKVLAKAVARGRQSATERARSVAAGRTPAGSSNRGFAQPSRTTLKEQILGGGKPGFGALLKEMASNK